MHLLQMLEKALKASLFADRVQVNKVSLIAVKTLKVSVIALK